MFCSAACVEKVVEFFRVDWIYVAEWLHSKQEQRLKEILKVFTVQRNIKFVI
jgi:hypothetical protein